MLYEGIKQPKLETHDRLVSFLAHKQMDTTEILCYKDTLALMEFYRTNIGTPNAQFFNRKKQLVDYRDAPNDCNAHVGIFMEKMDRINQMEADTNKQLKDYISNLAYADNMKPFKLEEVDYDLYLVMYWAKYVGKVNKHKIFEWETLANQAKKQGLKIRVIKISADYQALWGITKDQVPHFDY